jgi:trk system potassium uptake protein TrkH
MLQLNIRFIFKFLGIIHLLESFFLLMAAAVAFYHKEGDFYPLLISFGMMFVAGILFYIAGRKAGHNNIGRREGMLTVTLTWLLLSFFGMMPYLLGGYIHQVTDAYFETMSGFTTTGATILRDIESLPKGILFWRSLTQWQGGIGIIVFSVALMPVFGGTAMQLFDAEISGITHEHFLPRVAQIAKRFFGIYLLITTVLTLLLWAGPMSLYDAVNHALTTVSSGGFSTKNSSIAFWNNPSMEYLLSIFMCISATNFTLLYFAFKGKFKKIRNDGEFRWFYTIIFLTTIITAAWLFFQHHEGAFEPAFRKAIFHVTSLISTTGFLTSDFSTWGTFFTIIALMLMVVCGCAGSTSGGLKMGRFIILVKNMLNEFKKQTHPHAVIPVRIRDQVIQTQVVQRVQTFAFVYLVLIMIGCTIFLLGGLAFEESLGTAVSAISNIGPALGKYTAGMFADLPAISKWTYSFLMMIGRLEIFTVLTILLPGFWRQ